MTLQAVRVAGVVLAAVFVVTSCAILASIRFAGMVQADTDPQSPHYQFVESQLGAGGLVPATSAHYQSIDSTADTAVGNTASTNFQTEAGNPTTHEPTLSLSILSGGTTFNTLFSPVTTATATTQFSVEDYTSYGYIVQIVGTPPTNGTHQIAPMTSPSTSTHGIEQFGINVVKNTNFCGSGCDVGADPDYGQFGATSAGPIINLPSTNYGTSGIFEYNSGDTIVKAPKSSGEIIYTITYIVNVSGLTAGGKYTSDQTLICTGTY